MQHGEGSVNVDRLTITLTLDYGEFDLVAFAPMKYGLSVRKRHRIKQRFWCACDRNTVTLLDSLLDSNEQ